MTNNLSQDGLSQEGRTGKLATPLGRDKLVLRRFEGVEALGELFDFRVQAMSEDGNIDFDRLIGRNSSVHLATADGVGRDFSGVAVDARRIDKLGDLFVYSLVLRPWLWLLSLTSDCRIFRNMDARQIIKQVFQDLGFSDVLDLTTHNYPELEYCVQYRETHLNFVLRLMEKYGIYYYFQFEKGDGETPSIHYLVITDTLNHVPLAAPAKVPYLPVTSAARRDEQQFNGWTAGCAMVSGVSTLNDYNYEKPGADLLASAKLGCQFNHGDMEIYNFPGGYEDQGVGMDLARARRDSEGIRHQLWSAVGYAPSLAPGYTINRSSVHADDQEDGEYLVMRCSHVYGNQSYRSERVGAEGEAYVGAYEFAKSDVQFRMPLRTLRPVIAGAQSALVVGKQGEEIDVDELGRVCVQFYWDRKKKASRRVRVAQFWAGSHRGALFLPRIGDEVMVQYEDGDPDRPFVVGSVYNGANTVPAHLPDRKTISGILTKSSKHSAGYNMLLFDDTAGNERIKLRAQKDLMFKALNNEQRDILGSQTENVGGDVTQNVGGDETITVGSLTGGGNYSLSAMQTIELSVGPVTSIMITPGSVTITAPTINVTAMAAINISATTVNIGGIVNATTINVATLNAGTLASLVPPL